MALRICVVHHAAVVLPPRHLHRRPRQRRHRRHVPAVESGCVPWHVLHVTRSGDADDRRQRLARPRHHALLHESHDLLGTLLPPVRIDRVVGGVADRGACTVDARARKQYDEGDGRRRHDGGNAAQRGPRACRLQPRLPRHDRCRRAHRPRVGAGAGVGRQQIDQRGELRCPPDAAQHHRLRDRRDRGFRGLKRRGSVRAVSACAGRRRCRTSRARRGPAGTCGRFACR